MMDANVVGDPSLGDGNDGATDNRHDHDTGTVSGERSEFCNTQGEDAGKHNRVEQADEDDAVHSEMARSQHGGCDQAGSTDRTKRE